MIKDFDVIKTRRELYNKQSLSNVLTPENYKTLDLNKDKKESLEKMISSLSILLNHIYQSIECFDGVSWCESIEYNDDCIGFFGLSNKKHGYFLSLKRSGKLIIQEYHYQDHQLSLNKVNDCPIDNNEEIQKCLLEALEKDCDWSIWNEFLERLKTIPVEYCSPAQFSQYQNTEDSFMCYMGEEFPENRTCGNAFTELLAIHQLLIPFMRAVNPYSADLNMNGRFYSSLHPYICLRFSHDYGNNYLSIYHKRFFDNEENIISIDLDNDFLQQEEHLYFCII